MYRFLKALKGALQSVTGEGEVLADISSGCIYLYRPSRDTDLPCVVIWGVRKNNLANDSAGQRFSEFNAIVSLYVKLDENDDIETQAEAAADLGDKVERAFLDNPTLLCTDYPNGLLQDDDDSKLQVEEVYYYETAVLIPPEGRPVSMVQLIVRGVLNMQDGGISVW